MSVLVSLWMFGKPGMELREGEDITADEIRALQQELFERLGRAAEIVEQMTAAGWDAQMSLYDVMLSHPYVRTEADARTRLDDLGIDPEEVHIDEFEDEEDFEDEEGLDLDGEFDEDEEEFGSEESEFEDQERPESER
ncbi:MAG: hypothetical protein L0Z62_50075 [Gemmataceae bacterium]|nr:hypothetical protein [Gemmataceae bacterium]